MSSKNKRRKRVEIDNPVKNNSINFIAKNCLAGIVLVVLLKIVLFVPGYNWMLNSLIRGNLEIVKKYPNISIEEKYSLKYNLFGNLMNHIRKNTPEEAIILIPNKDVIKPLISSKNKMNKLKSKAIVTNFLYPRKIVMEEFKDEEEYFDKITYVLIVNSYGYQYLNYEFNSNIQLGILPVDKEK